MRSYLSMKKGCHITLWWVNEDGTVTMVGHYIDDPETTFEVLQFDDVLEALDKAATMTEHGWEVYDAGGELDVIEEPDRYVIGGYPGSE